MLGKRLFYLAFSILIGLFIVGVFLGVVYQARASVTQNTIAIEEQTFTETQQTIYLPIAKKYYPWYNMFGVESRCTLMQGDQVFRVL